MVAELRPAAAYTPVGGSGRPAGVTGADGNDATEDPIALTAITVNVYAIVFRKPGTTTDVPIDVTVTDSGFDITV
jgi:hypothetical protein